MCHMKTYYQLTKDLSVTGYIITCNFYLNLSYKFNSDILNTFTTNKKGMYFVYPTHFVVVIVVNNRVSLLK